MIINAPNAVHASLTYLLSVHTKDGNIEIGLGTALHQVSEFNRQMLTGLTS